MKILWVFLSAVIVLCLSSCGCDKEYEITRIEESVPPAEEIKEQEELIELYEQAVKNGDYIGMNNAQYGLENKDFDYTHGGIVTMYDYAYTNTDGNEVKGKVYFLDLPNGFSFAKAEGVADSQSIEETDYIVIDYTHLSDPRLQVRDSYKADNYHVRECVIDILLKYDAEKNTALTRTKDSMEMEWYVHNLSYAAGYEPERAKHVDFNNDDEEVY